MKCLSFGCQLIDICLNVVLREKMMLSQFLLLLFLLPLYGKFSKNQPGHPWHASDLVIRNAIVVQSETSSYLFNLSLWNIKLVSHQRIWFFCFIFRNIRSVVTLRPAIFDLYLTLFLKYHISHSVMCA